VEQCVRINESKKMKKLFFSLPVLCLLASSKASSQTDTAYHGIIFEQNRSWNEILTKAKVENKYVFVDFYTTWCAPCKQMEKYIYPLKKVGDFFNRNFVSVKVQMDKTARDNEQVKNWYEEAKKMEKNFSINVYPTYLFLSSEGKPLHRAAGGFPEQKFLELAANALDPDKQSYTLYARYIPNRMDTASLKKVAKELKFTNPELSQTLAIAYFKNLGVANITTKEQLNFLMDYREDSAIQNFARGYISKQKDGDLFTRDNISFIIKFLNSSLDRGFKLFYKNPYKIDEVMNAGSSRKHFFAKKWVDQIIYKEEIAPLVDKAKTNNTIPDWEKINRTIRAKYHQEYADRNIIAAKKTWYFNNKNFPEYTKYVLLYLDKYGANLEFDFGWNNYAWEVFKYSSSKEELSRALEWSRRALLVNPVASWMDTYANILYKLGRNREALDWEFTACKLEPGNKEFAEALQKMKAGLPTWSEGSN
jgi:thioredoxin-related protein